MTTTANPTTGIPVPVDEPIPDFDERSVTGTAMKFSGMSGEVPCDDRLLRMDDVVNLTVQGVITGVAHKVNKNGEMIRVQTIKVVDLEFTPFNPADPDDKGVIRG